jgi:hypothetical protein
VLEYNRDVPVLRGADLDYASRWFLANKHFCEVFIGKNLLVAE